MGNTVFPLRFRFVTFRELCKCLPLWEPPLRGTCHAHELSVFQLPGLAWVLSLSPHGAWQLAGLSFHAWEFCRQFAPYGVSLCAWQMSPPGFCFLRLVS